jgi:hypothetical protein
LGCATPQAENWAITAAPHRFPGFPCGEFLFSDFRRQGSEKKKVCPVVKKKSRQIPKRLFLFKQSYIIKLFVPDIYTKRIHPWYYLRQHDLAL